MNERAVLMLIFSQILKLLFIMLPPSIKSLLLKTRQSTRTHTAAIRNTGGHVLPVSVFRGVDEKRAAFNVNACAEHCARARCTCTLAIWM